MWSLRLSTASASFPAVQNRAVNMLWTCQHIQRDLVRLQGWACTKLKKFNNAKYEVLHLSWGSPKHKHRLGREWIESSFEKKDLGLLFHEKLCMKGQCALATQKADFILGWITRSVAAGQGRWLHPSNLLLWDLTWSTLFSSGACSTRKTWSSWRRCWGGHEDDQRVETPFL